MRQTKIGFVPIKKPNETSIKPIKQIKPLYIKKQPDYKDIVVTYTWCECGENHHGNQQIGEIVEPGQGFNLDDLLDVKTYAKTKFNCKSKIFDLKKLGLKDENDDEMIINRVNRKNNKLKRVEVNDAYFLLIKNFIPSILKKHNLKMEDLMNEVMEKKWDSKFWDPLKKKVLNKHARKNNCISEIEQTAKYDEGKGTIHSFESMPIMNLLRGVFKDMGGKFDFPCSEGNLYEDGGKKKNGIGWHGDSERRRVLSMRLGLNPSMPFNYRWQYKNKEIGKLMIWEIKAGDVMVMSEWAVGTEWKNKNKVTLVHSTGAPKYVKSKTQPFV